MPLEVVNLRINRENGRASIAFPCALCGVRSDIPVSPSSVMVLRNAGLDPVYWSYPSELTERDADPRRSFPERSVEGLMRELESDIDSFLRSP